VEIGPLEIKTTTTKSFVYAESPGGKGDARTVKSSRTDLTIVNRGSVTVNASGTDDNAQAKTRAGYFLVLRGSSKCGPWGRYQVQIEE
jgi:hypothetical protein